VSVDPGASNVNVASKNDFESFGLELAALSLKQPMDLQLSVMSRTGDLTCV
jgi:hypothetical protein